MGSFYKNKYFRRRSDTRWVLTVNTSSRGTLSTGFFLFEIRMNECCEQNVWSFETKYCQCLDHSLYSLKWYRDDREFFRYIPQGRPLRPQRCTFSKDPKTNYHCSMLTTFSNTNYKIPQKKQTFTLPFSQSRLQWRYFCCTGYLCQTLPPQQGGVFIYFHIFIYISIYWTISFCHCS